MHYNIPHVGKVAATDSLLQSRLQVKSMVSCALYYSVYWHGDETVYVILCSLLKKNTERMSDVWILKSTELKSLTVYKIPKLSCKYCLQICDHQ